MLAIKPIVETVPVTHDQILEHVGLSCINLHKSHVVIHASFQLSTDGPCFDKDLSLLTGSRSGKSRTPHTHSASAIRLCSFLSQDNERP